MNFYVLLLIYALEQINMEQHLEFALAYLMLFIIFSKIVVFRMFTLLLLRVLIVKVPEKCFKLQH